jgi:tritrans,polycis-undecaprenyl-diphosphate synthase [geranylgeranyl-diphosphate specific]
MRRWVRRHLRSAYESLLRREIAGAPEHVAVIQDGNRRYARERGDDPHTGHREGAETTEAVLDWCKEQGIEEVTLYAFSTENFERDPEEREQLFDLIADKLHDIADSDRTHRNELRIQAIGDVDRLPERVQDAVAYAERRTGHYDAFVCNVALAYGGRAELLNVTREIARDVDDGSLDPGDVTVEEVEARLHDDHIRDVDLIIRTGGDERVSNFLPWHANGNEAAVFFCAPYWPEFSKVDFLRAIRTYEAREKSWRRTRAKRALAIVSAVKDAELEEARGVLGRLREYLPQGEGLESVDGVDGVELGEEEPAD